MTFSALTHGSARPHPVRPDRLVTGTALLMLGTDVGFLVYWALISTHALPPSAMFSGYDEPAVAAWNWSFLPLDVLASLTGFAALRALRVGRPNAATLMAVSLALTAAAGGMALVYWAIRCDVRPTWWLPNAYLLLFPLPLLVRMARTVTPPRFARTHEGKDIA